MKTRSLYIHIPFCNSICSYCDFCKVYYQKELVDKYLKKLAQEISSLKIKDCLKTVYIGGGTPSSLDYNQLDYLMKIIEPYINQETIEFCIEVNPESMDKKKLEILSNGKINRLSIGVQTFNQDLLELIERKHTANQVVNLIGEAKNYGIDNISIDLMYGLPKQKLEDIKKDIEIAISLDVKHISYYSLILEDYTILKNKGYQVIDDEVENEINDYVDENLEKAGFYKYEVSNYSKIGYESKHNLVYWNYDNYYGVGIGASSKIDNYLINHNRNLYAYINGENIEEVEELNNDEVVFNQIMMSLRLLEGLNVEQVKDRYGIDILEKYHHVIKKYSDLKMLSIKDSKLSCTKKSIKYLNEILIDFMQ